MPRRPADLTGRRYGLLTVIGLSGQRSAQGRALYLCRCDCGGERLATRSNLERGEIVSCGCRNHLPKKDLAGQRFGRLTVLGIAAPPAGRKRTVYQWRCRCDCGTETIVSVNALTTGNTQSCGCLQREAVSALYQDGTAPHKLLESQKPRATNTSGITGVWWDGRKQKWAAELIFQGKKYFLGRFVNKEDAIFARKEAENQIFGEYLSGL